MPRSGLWGARLPPQSETLRLRGGGSRQRVRPSRDRTHPSSPGPNFSASPPQALAFQVTTDGMGPRIVRIELDNEEGLRTLEEVQLEAPVRDWSLDFVARFGEQDPDRFALMVVIEAPHASPRLERYPIQLATQSHRFWDSPQED